MKDAPYCCPQCKTNRSRFHLIKQLPQSVRLDPLSGAIIETYDDGNKNPLHMEYKGPELRVQCAICGLIEDEQTFIQFGKMRS